jgi:hypothetical protein
MPGTMYMSFDTDILEKLDGNALTIIADYKNNASYMAVSVKDANVHVMNKFSLGRIIDKEFKNE